MKAERRHELQHNSLAAFLSRLREAGVGHAEWTRHCTYRDPARFYSYRRTTHAGEADYGRLISVIGTLFGLNDQVSVWSAIAVLPIFMWELALGLWLTFRGAGRAHTLAPVGT